MATNREEAGTIQSGSSSPKNISPLADQNGIDRNFANQQYQIERPLPDDNEMNSDS